jgi:hypothetical protein
MDGYGIWIIGLLDYWIIGYIINFILNKFNYVDEMMI